MKRWPTVPTTLIMLGLASGCGDAPRDGILPEAVTNAASQSQAVLGAASFFEAALAGNLGAVDMALKAGAGPDAADANMRTALMLAAFNGHVPVMRRLLAAGADISRCDTAGRTALMFAATGDDPEAVSLLLEKGADVNRCDRGEGWTALMWAAAEGRNEIVKVLLLAGANPAATDKDGDTARVFALQNGHGGTAKLLENQE